MMQRMKHHQEIVTALVAENHVMRALDYALEHNVHSMRLSGLLDNVEQAREIGDDCKAAMLIKRLQEIKKLDETKLKAVPNYKPLLIEE